MVNLILAHGSSGFFVAVCFSPLRKSQGEWGAVAPATPAPRRRGAMSLRCSQALKSARGVASLARGPLAPLKSRFKGIGFSGKGGNRNPPFPERVFGYFLHEQKVTRGPGAEPPGLSTRSISRPHPPDEGRISPGGVCRADLLYTPNTSPATFADWAASLV